MVENENDMNEFFNKVTDPYPFIKEVSYSSDSRKIRISTGKGIIIAAFILIGVQIIFTIIAFTVFADDNFLKMLFCFIELPFLLIILLIPAYTICIYDYNSKIFISYIIPIIPIPYLCYTRNKINFYDIEGFFLEKKLIVTKHYYKVGVKLKDGQQRVIMVGQEVQCERRHDRRDLIPFILRRLLKSGEQNIV